MFRHWCTDRSTWDAIAPIFKSVHGYLCVIIKLLSEFMFHVSVSRNHHIFSKRKCQNKAGQVIIVHSYFVKRRLGLVHNIRQKSPTSPSCSKTETRSTSGYSVLWNGKTILWAVGIHQGGQVPSLSQTQGAYKQQFFRGTPQKWYADGYYSNNLGYVELSGGQQQQQHSLLSVQQRDPST